MLRVEELMTTEVEALRPSDTVARAEQQMTRIGVHHLPVIDATRRVLGIIARHDLMRARALPGNGERPVGDVMSSPVETIEPEEPAFRAVELMLDRRIGAIPVVDEKGTLIGIVSETDFLQVAHRALHGRTGYELANL
jgi:CBS domain-containing protein